MTATTGGFEPEPGDVPPPDGAEAVGSQLLADLGPPVSVPPPAPGRKRGRPKGSGSKASKPSPVAQEKSSERDPAEKMLAVQAMATAGALLWKVAAPVTKCRPLTDDEALALGTALDPVVEKYLPMLGDWKAETTLLITIFALYEATKIQRAIPEGAWPEN